MFLKRNPRKNIKKDHSSYRRDVFVLNGGDLSSTGSKTSSVD